MRNQLRAEQSVKDFALRKARKLYNAKLGNNAGVVETGTAGFWWIRLHGDNNQVMRARSSTDITPVAGIDIVVELVARVGLPYYQILGRALGILYPTDPYTTLIGEHHSQHERWDLGEGGHDPVDVWARMIVPLRGQVQVIPDLTLYVQPGFYFNNSVLTYYAGGNSPAFTLPSGSIGITVRRCDLLYLSFNDTLAIATGTETTDGSLPALPTSPADCCYAIAYVYLYSTMSSLHEVDIRDARPLGSSALESLPSSKVTIPVVGAPTYNTEEELQTLTNSAGVLDASITYITQQDATHINVAAGKGLIRISNSPLAQLVSFEWAASNNIAIPAGASGVDTVRFVGIEYNAGSPQVTVRTSFNWNWYSDFPLGRVSQDGTTLRIINTYAHSEDTANLARRFNRLTMPFQREEAPEGSGGLIISAVTSGGNSQYIGMTAGNIWHGFNRFLLAAVDTSVAGRFDSHYQNGTGGFVNVLNQQQWNNTQYDNGSGTLATLTNNHYGNHWVYLDVSDGSLDVVFGYGNYNSLADAQAETAPALIPGHLQYHGRLLGRIIFKKSDTAPTLVQSVFDSALSISGGSGGVGGSGTAGKLAQWTTGSAIGDATNTDAQVASAVAASHDAVTVVDTASINLSLTGQQISADAIFGTGVGTIAQGNDARLSDRRNPKLLFLAVTLAVGSYNDYDPGQDAQIISITPSGGTLITLTGMARGSATHNIIFLTATSGAIVTLAHESSSSSPGNRFYSATGSDLVFGSNDVIALVYDTNANRLRAQTFTESLLHLSDVTTANATTSAHGLAPKATAPAAGTINFLGIENTETVRADKAASSNPTTAKILQSDTTGEIKPRGDAAGVDTRLVLNGVIAANKIDDRFDAGSIDAAWAWAGAPFVTPDTKSLANSAIRIAHGTANNRAFLYRTDNLNKTSWGRFALSCLTNGIYVGLREDDGSDNNYIECALRLGAANSFDVIQTYRTGGGAVTTTQQHVFGAFPMWIILRLYVYGTFYTNWNWYGETYIDSPGSLLHNTHAGLTWTATRRGIVFNLPTGGSSWETGYIDWFGTT